jgi:HSP20 family protein
MSAKVSQWRQWALERALCALLHAAFALRPHVAAGRGRWRDMRQGALMNLTTWKKRGLLNGNFVRLRDEIDRTIGRFLGEHPSWFGGVAGFDAEEWVPPIDIVETDGQLLVKAEVPGIASRDLDVSVIGHTLSISGKKSEARETREGGVCQSERAFGAFRRNIELSDTVDPESVTAECENGLLTVTMARRSGMKPRHVEVKPVGRRVSLSEGRTAAV